MNNQEFSGPHTVHTMTDSSVLSSLFDPSTTVRLEAVRNVDRSSASAYALRAVALFDRAVVVREAAANALGRFEDPSVGAMLRDALRDPSPLVRDAAARSIARCGAVELCDALQELALNDENWGVRRTCVFAYSALAGFDSVPTLMAVLEEPFWRVRHGAVMMLEALGRASDTVREKVQAQPLATDAAKRAVTYLSSRWAMQAPALNVRGDHESYDNDPWYDDDPAVMTAKVLAKTPPPDRLIAMLGESHEPLRKLAIAALSRCGDRLALAGAACWLDVPRVPHAAAAARKVLRVSGQAGVDVAIAAVDTKLPSVAAWAMHICAANGRIEMGAKILARVSDEDPRVRAAVAFAVPVLAEHYAQAIQCAVDLSRDRVPSVRQAAVGALVQLKGDLVEGTLRGLSLKDLTPQAKIALVHWAAFEQEIAILRAAAADSHSYVAGTALSALRSLGLLTDSERAKALASADPWIRGAVVMGHDALDVLANEQDPVVKRIAIDRVCAEKSAMDPQWIQRVAAIARLDADPWVRARGLRLSDASDDEALAALVEGTADRALMTRAAAVEALDADEPSMSARIAALLRSEKISARAQSAALSWVARSANDPALALKELAQLPSLREKVAVVGLTLSDEQQERLSVVRAPVAAAPALAPRVFAAYPTESHRKFGRTSLRLSPLAFSGVSEAPEAAFVEARERGVNTFFWEPRHRNLTRFVRKSPKKHSLHILAGTYHADAASIRADVETALRRLKVEQLGVFLLFWARSHNRLNDETFALLEQLKSEGKIAAHGFSTHLRTLAVDALARQPWDVVMTRYNAAHVNAEKELLPAIQAHGAAGIAFTALCYGRLLRPVGQGAVRAVGESPVALPTASELYRFAVSNPAVNLVLSAPSSMHEAREALKALHGGPLSPERMAAVRAHGAAVYTEDTQFNALIRKGDRIQLGSPRDVALGFMDAYRAEL